MFSILEVQPFLSNLGFDFFPPPEMGTTLEAMAETPGLSLGFHFVSHPQLLMPLWVIQSQKSPLSIPILSTHLDLLTCQESPLYLQAQ